MLSQGSLKLLQAMTVVSLVTVLLIVRSSTAMLSQPDAQVNVLVYLPEVV